MYPDAVLQLEGQLDKLLFGDTPLIETGFLIPKIFIGGSAFHTAHTLHDFLIGSFSVTVLFRAIEQDPIIDLCDGVIVQDTGTGCSRLRGFFILTAALAFQFGNLIHINLEQLSDFKEILTVIECHSIFRQAGSVVFVVPFFVQPAQAGVEIQVVALAVVNKYIHIQHIVQHEEIGFAYQIQIHKFAVQ